MLELRWIEVHPNDVNGLHSPNVDTGTVALQYREKIEEKANDSRVTYWAWTEWQDVEIE